MPKSFALFIIILSLSITASSQQFEWQAGVDAFLDNREYFSIENPQTIFGTRFHFEAGGSISDVHSLRAGINYLYEFGHRPDAYKPDPTIYYQYDDGRIMLNAGAFPRRNRLDYPLALLSDTLLYFRPNIQGLYLAYSGDWGYQNVFIDWTSRQTDVNPEQFIFGFSGLVNWKFLYFSHHVMMAHMAGAGIPVPGFHLRDNGGMDINLGANLSDKIFLDTLTFSAGALVSFDRTREVDVDWQTPTGFLGQFSAMYKWMGIKGLYYNGQGHTFLFGDPFYRLKNYGRLDFIVAPFRTGPVRMKFDIGLHFAEHQIDYSQQVMITMILDGSRPFRR